MKQLLVLSALIIASLGAVSQNANADIFIEPFIGYQTGEVSFDQIGIDGDDSAGTAYGARLGWGMLGFSGGVQFETGSSTIDLTASSGSGTVERDFEPTNTGVFVNINLPILFRLWGTYFLSSKAALDNIDLDLNGGGSTNGKLDIEGGGSEIGIGFTGLPFIAINLSMINMTYDDNDHPEVAASGVKIKELEYKAYMLSVSLPLSF